MTAPRIRVDYQLLARVATIFRSQADSVNGSHRGIARQVKTLEGGDWSGRGANAFYREMHEQVLPALKRLSGAFEAAQETVVQTDRLMNEAEEQAASLLSGQRGSSVSSQFGLSLPSYSWSGAGFSTYDELSEGQRSLFENLQGEPVKVTRGGETHAYSKIGSGRAFYESMQNVHPKALANFLNQTAVLESIKFEDGRTALSYVKNVSEFHQDRLYVELQDLPDLHDPEKLTSLSDRINEMSGGSSEDGKRFIGPVDTPAHGDYSVTYRENVPEGAQQISFNPEEGYLEADIDIDHYNPEAGRGFKHAVLEVIPNFLTGSKTDPFDVYERISAREDIQLNYEPPEK